MSGEQIDWVDRRDAGMYRAQQKAHRECGDEWTSTAATFLYCYAARVVDGAPFLIEDARAIAHSPPYVVPRNTNAKAWGAAVAYAKRKGWIRSAGYAPAKSSNGSPKCVWEWAK